jgi:hypothetical protein
MMIWPLVGDSKPAIMRGGFAAPRGAEDRGERAFFDLKRNAFDSQRSACVRAVSLRDVFEFNAVVHGVSLFLSMVWISVLQSG